MGFYLIKKSFLDYFYFINKFYNNFINDFYFNNYFNNNLKLKKFPEACCAVWFTTICG
jgi:hypothetical protein